LGQMGQKGALQINPVYLLILFSVEIILRTVRVIAYECSITLSAARVGLLRWSQSKSTLKGAGHLYEGSFTFSRSLGIVAFYRYML